VSGWLKLPFRSTTPPAPTATDCARTLARIGAEKRAKPAADAKAAMTAALLLDCYVILARRGMGA